jgi:hypothetical protein
VTVAELGKEVGVDAGDIDALIAALAEHLDDELGQHVSHRVLPP